MKRVRPIAAWLAIVALLIDGLLPAAVSAATVPGGAPPFALCSAAGGDLPPAHAPPPLPARHCALCAVCTGCVIGLLPNRVAGPTARISVGDTLPAIARSTPLQARRTAFAVAQPRAPPETTS